ncbi:MAG: helix-turn-helix domain-containing protein [Eggerthellaceae bacterium]
MERAAALLRETDLRVADIGLAVGYDSPSKFTAAFKAVIGQTPTVHRRDRARYVR